MTRINTAVGDGGSSSLGPIGPPAGLPGTSMFLRFRRLKLYAAVDPNACGVLSVSLVYKLLPYIWGAANSGATAAAARLTGGAGWDIKNDRNQRWHWGWLIWRLRVWRGRIRRPYNTNGGTRAWIRNTPTAVSKRITSTSSSASSSTILTPTCDTTVTVQTRGVGPRQRIVHRIGVAVEALGIGNVVAAIVGIGAQPATLGRGQIPKRGMVARILLYPAASRCTGIRRWWWKTASRQRAETHSIPSRYQNCSSALPAILNDPHAGTLAAPSACLRLPQSLSFRHRSYPSMPRWRVKKSNCIPPK